MEHMLLAACHNPSSEHSQPPDPAPVLDLLDGFRRSQVLFAASELGLFAHIAAGSATGSTLRELRAGLHLHGANATTRHAIPEQWGDHSCPESSAATLSDHATPCRLPPSTAAARQPYEQNVLCSVARPILPPSQHQQIRQQQLLQPKSVAPADRTDGLEQLLHACVALGLLQLSSSSPALPVEVQHAQEHKYWLTPLAAAYLVPTAANSLTGYVKHSSKVVYPLFGGLSHSVCTGQPAWQHQFGYTGQDPFQHIYRTPEDQLQFMAGMHSFARLSAPALAAAFDLSKYRSAVDLGGATGALAVALCELYVSLLAVVVDLPEVVQVAQQHFLSPPHCIAQPGTLQRVRWMALDFLQQADQLPHGDLFVLSRILHDWDQLRIAQLLAVVHERLPVGGALLVCEMLLDEDGHGPATTTLQSLNMLGILEAHIGLLEKPTAAGPVLPLAADSQKPPLDPERVQPFHTPPHWLHVC